MIRLELEEALSKGDTQPLFKAATHLKGRASQLKSSATAAANMAKKEWEEYNKVIDTFEAARAVLMRVLLEYDIKQNSKI